MDSNGLAKIVRTKLAMLTKLVKLAKIAGTKLAKFAKLVTLSKIARSKLSKLHDQIAKLELNFFSYTIFN